MSTIRAKGARFVDTNGWDGGRPPRLVLARRQLDALRDGLYVLQCAVDDVDRDLPGRSAPTRQELDEALSWVLEAARGVIRLDM